MDLAGDIFKEHPLQCYAPYKIIGYKIILPYFGQKNAKIIDPTFFPSHTVYYVYCML